MTKDFAIKLDQAFSVFNSKDTILYENATEDLGKLVKEAYETDLKEDIIEKVNTDGNLITADLGHFEIKTFCLKF